MGCKFDQVILESSPFMRVMATASRVAKALNIEEVGINYLYSEFLSDGVYETNPMKRLQIVRGKS